MPNCVKITLKNKQESARKRNTLNLVITVELNFFRYHKFTHCSTTRKMHTGRFYQPPTRIEVKITRRILPTDNPLVDHLPNPCRIYSRRFQRLALQSPYSYKHQRSRSRLLEHYLYYVVSKYHDCQFLVAYTLFCRRQ